MKIGLASLLGIVGGPGVIATNQIKNIIHLDKKNSYVIFSDSFDKIDVQCRKIVTPMPFKSFRLIVDHAIIPYYLKKEKIKIFHNLKETLPFYRIKGCKYVCTIFDLAPWYYPNTFPFKQRLHLKVHLKIVAKNADIIVTGSNNTKLDIIKLLNVPKEKIKVVYFAPGENYKVMKDEDKINRVLRKYKLPKSYFLYVGTLQPRKNIDKIIKAYYLLKKDMEITHKLVIVGRKGWLWKDFFRLVKILKLQNDVIFSGVIPQNELPYVYNGATLFISPSSYEGFGMTLAEAMASGVPIISANNSAIPEVVGDAALLLNNITPSEIAKAMKELLKNEKLREGLIAKGLQQVKKFSWKSHALKLIEIYEQLM